MCVCVSADLLGLSDTLQGDPGRPHHGVPDEAFVPHLHKKSQVQTVDLTEDTKSNTKPLKDRDSWTNMSLPLNASGRPQVEDRRGREET